jgi:hypothetical protein
MDTTNFVQTLVEAEIRHQVTRAAREGGIVWTRAITDAVLQVYPKVDISDRQIADMVIAEATRAKVPLEVGG